MKKITLSLALLASTLSTIAQENFYNFSQRTSTYTDLVSPIILNDGAIEEEDILELQLSFPVEIFGIQHDFLVFETNFYFFSSNIESGLYNTTGYLRDRNFTDTGLYQSPISYKVEGETGNRILKLEMKNVGFEEEYYLELPSTTFANYQIWYYEQDKSIEYHYGPHNITDMTIFNDGDINAIALFTERYDEEVFHAGYLTFNLQNPVYVETADYDQEPESFNTVPSANTVYKFTPNVPTSSEGFDAVTFEIFPNPTSDVLHITKLENDRIPYIIYNMAGKKVLGGELTNTQETIHLETLSTGSYLIKVGATVKKFIKK